MISGRTSVADDLESALARICAAQQTARDVGGPGAHVEQGERRVWPDRRLQVWGEGAPRQVRAAEQAVDPLEVAQIACQRRPLERTIDQFSGAAHPLHRHNLTS